MRVFLGKNRVKKCFPCGSGRSFVLSVFIAFLVSIGVLGTGCFLGPSLAEAQGSEKAILNSHHPLIQEAMEVQHRHMGSLMNTPDVVGTGVAVGPDGLPVIKVFTKTAGAKGIPEWLESIPVHVEVTGMVVALGCPDGRTGWCDRPVPIGVSTGHPAITAGTIGARVKDSAGTVYALSNNHVYADSNNASIGDSVLQPGPYDGATDSESYRIGTLFAFQPIDFSSSGVNYIDAAIALSSSVKLGNATLQDGYGAPSSVLAGPSVNLPVQKYGRTTGLTHGTVSAINASVEVCYEQSYRPPFGYFCTASAYFYDQIQISPAGFSAGGDSGSLIVTDDGNKNPVGLLFAGSDTTTFANRISRVLDTFTVTIDGDADPAPALPEAPTGLSATAVSSSQINLTWTDTSTNEQGFTIERCSGAGCTIFAEIATVGAGVTAYQDTGLLASTSYSYRVRAYNSGGSSDYSTIATGATQAAPALPEAPTGLRATAVSKSQVNLAWTDNASNETGFKIERCKGPTCTNFSQIAIVGADVTTYSNTGLAKNTAYRYRVRAYNTSGNSAYSTIVSVKTLK